MSIPLIAAIISALGLILGSAIGAICSWFISKISLKEQIKLQQQNMQFQEKYKTKEMYISANIIRLDLCNAIYQSIRYLKSYGEKNDFYSIPIYKDYHRIVASLNDNYSLKELSYIYQLYGLIEKVNINISDIKNLNNFFNVRCLFVIILKKVYGENYLKILKKDIDNISYEELYTDELMKEGYRKLFNSLDNLCKNNKM